MVLAKFNVGIIETHGKAWGSWEVRASYKTALVYKDGVNVMTMHTSSDPDYQEMYKEMRTQALVEDGVPEAIAHEMATWIAENVVGVRA